MSFSDRLRNKSISIISHLERTKTHESHDSHGSHHQRHHHEPEGPASGDPFVDMGHDFYQNIQRRQQKVDPSTDDVRGYQHSEMHSFLLLYGLIAEPKRPWWSNMPRWLRDIMSHRLPPEALKDLDSGPTRDELDQSSFSRAWVVFKTFCVFLSHTQGFQIFFLVIILLNTVFMGFQVDADWSDGLKDSLDSCFIALFLIEAIIRVMAYGDQHLYTHKGLLIFECLVVFIAVVDKWMIPLLLATRHSIDLSTITVFRVFRMLQVVRMLEVVNFTRPLRLMERAISRATMYFFWNFIFLVSLAYICALGFRIYLIKLDSTRPNFGFQRNYFGNTFYTLVYLMEAVWDGMSWSQILFEPLEEDSNTLICSWMLFATIFVLDLAVSVMVAASFIENNLSAVKKEANEVDRDFLTRQMDITGLYEILESCDEKGDGRLTLLEFLLPLHDPHPRFKARKHKLLKCFKLQRNPGEDKELFSQRCEYRLSAFFKSCDLGHELSVKIDLIVWGYLKLVGSSGTVDTILRDYQFKRLINYLESPDKDFHTLSEHIDRLKRTIKEQTEQAKYCALVLEQSLTPFEESLASLEKRFEEVSKSLEWMNQSTAGDEASAPGAAGVASLMLRVEMDALKKAALELRNEEEPPSQSPWWELRGDNLFF